jgi:DNA-directed RNA polymerase subunit RPC12/RpoP
MSLPKDFPLVDMRGKKSINCPHCGFKIDIPLREISMSKLKHMAEVKQFGKWTEQFRNKETIGIGNSAVMICPQCNKPILCIDEFTTIHRGK